MFLKGWYNTVTSFITGYKGYVKDITNTDTYLSNTSCSALQTLDEAAINSTNYLLKFKKGSNYSQGIIFGSGNEAPKFDDYKLSGDPLNNKNLTVSINKTLNKGDNCITKTIELIITNGESSAITIGEIGLAGNVSGSGTGSTGKGFVLFDRTALEKPATIDAGGTATLTYTIDFPFV